MPDLTVLPGERVALLAHGGEPLSTLALTGPLTLLVGAEREGLPGAVIEACEHRARIPIAAGVESLNAAMAATVALYEMTRKQDGRGGEGEQRGRGDEATPEPSSRVRA
jgi:TrmH family RNA methyltransferase